MQKHNLLLLCFAAFQPGLLPAQPVLQNDVFPEPGDTWIIARAASDGVTPGPAGADQNWNFSTLQTLYVDAAQTVIAAAGTPNEADFPLANLCFSSPGWNGEPLLDYYRDSPAGQFYVLGSAYYGQLEQFTDPELLLQAPLAFGESFADHFARHNYLPDNSLQGVGDKTVVYDAYGTLLTAAGTFSQAMRLHTTTYLRDTFWLFAGYAVHTDTVQTFQWRQAGQPTPLLTIETRRGVQTFYIQGQPLDTTVKPEEKRVSFLTNPASGAGEPGGALSGIALEPLWPNPAVDVLRLQFSSAATGLRLRISLIDAGGRVLRTQNLEAQAGLNTALLPVADLPSGAYFLTLSDGRGAQTLGWQRF